MAINTMEFTVGSKTYTFKQGVVANQANGAVLVQCGESIVLVTACMGEKPKEGVDFFPLTCDYEERKYAVGKIPGGFVKRGGRPSEKAILTSRVIDRPVRPLFPAGMRNDVQVVAMPLSMEEDNPADMLAVLGASCALTISDIPWHGPLGCVRVCRVDGEFVVNPSLEQQKNTDLNLTLAATDGRVLEIEFEGSEISEDVLNDAIEVAHAAIDEEVAAIRKFAEMYGKPKADVPLVTMDPELYAEIDEKISGRLAQAIREPDKSEKESAIFQLKDALAEELAEEYPERAEELPEILDKLIKKQVRKMIITEGARPDGRALDQIRPLNAQVGWLPRVHGSSLFSRGQTQVMTALTLGSLDDAQIVDNLEEDTEKYFMHYYNFPPYSVGEARPIRSAGRREIGHGALAEKALRPVMPTKDEFPYTVLATSEVMESNGSTSMASTCGLTLALMDAGVKISAPVAGISIGLVSDETTKVLLTDIQALEDFTGDMDFKVTGTRKGVTAIQVDTKLEGLDRDVVKGALEMAKVARYRILDLFDEVLPGGPREELSKYAPRVYTVKIDPDKIGALIGPGGKVIKKIEADTGANLTIEQDGTVYITSTDAAGGDAARKFVEDLTREVELGEVFEGKVTRTEAFGAFVELLPGKEGLVHISQMAKERVAKTEDVANVGDIVKVKVIELGDDGKIRLTMRGFAPDDLDYVPPTGQTSGGGRGGRDRGRDRSRKPADGEAPKVKFRPKR